MGKRSVKRSHKAGPSGTAGLVERELFRVPIEDHLSSLKISHRDGERFSIGNGRKS